MLNQSRIIRRTEASPALAHNHQAPPAAPADTAASQDALITPALAAVHLGVTPKVLERWRGTGCGPQFVRLSTKSVRYRLQDLTAFIESRLRASTAG